MNHPQVSQKPAQASSKAMFNSEKLSKEELQQKALTNALTSESVANFQAIFEGFEAKGIKADDIEPRVNVFTFKAWKALGRVVMRGEQGVKIVTVIPCEKKDPETGEKTPVKKIKTTTVFHISQTQALDAAPVEPQQQAEAVTVEPAAIAEPSAEDVAAPEVEATPAPRELNAYEAKQAARRERYEDRAANAQALSQATYERARDMASVIPFGQPILVGHHSERRDRNYRGKIDNTFGKSFALMDKADHYTQKAESVGTGGISSDDPDAVQKLRAQLESAERVQESMKAANKAIRSNKTPESQKAALVALGFSEVRAAQVLEKDFAGRVGFASYQLSNNNANIKRIQGRIAELEKLKQRVDVEQVGKGFIYREDTTENRVMFLFEGKPDEATRKLLKGHSFNWSPSRDGKPWVRKLTAEGIWHAQQVIAALNVTNIGD
jgi:hypothetical protein